VGCPIAGGKRVGLGDGQVVVGHGQGLVAEYALQGKDVAAVAQEGDGPDGGVAVAVGIGAGGVDQPRLLGNHRFDK